MLGFNVDRLIFKNRTKCLKMQLFYLVLAVLFILIDQIVKMIVVSSLNFRDSILIIPGIVKATYLKNYGAAFNIMLKKTLFLIVFTIFMICFLIYYIVDKKVINRTYLFSACLIVSGGIGNLIDRVLRGYVVDYINLIFWPLEDFAVFNFADCLVIVGSIIFVVSSIKKEFFKNNIRKNKRL